MAVEYKATRLQTVEGLRIESHKLCAMVWVRVIHVSSGKALKSWNNAPCECGVTTFAHRVREALGGIDWTAPEDSLAKQETAIREALSKVSVTR